MIPVPYIFIGLIAATALRPKKAVPAGASGASIPNAASDHNGEQNRARNGRVISNRRRRNCRRCVST